ncbi:Tex family protein [Cytophagaceae bacterium ABcell3]|nr:Tex family protein [Cytophagaceae bacterium ABcell3]
MHSNQIAQELNLPEKNVQAVLKLLEEGATVPFISRYRKEMTGSLDEVFITSIKDRNNQLTELAKRREAILKSVKDQGKLTEELEDKIKQAETMSELEDIYLPYKPKRRTRATIAREKGLEPLAEMLLAQDSSEVVGEAEKYVDAEKQVNSSEEALAGARDIIAEKVNEDQEARKKMRNLFTKKGIVQSRVIPGKEKEGEKYKDYFEWEEEISKVPSHRMLAMRRGEREMILMLDIYPPEDDAIDLLEKQFVKSNNEAGAQVKLAVTDSYKRLLKPSMETEVRMGSKLKADDEAIRVFSDNIKQLLLAAPLGQKNILAIDPAFRTGCKTVVLNRQGKLMHYTTIFPHDYQHKVAEAEAELKGLCEKYKVEAVAIGNGTACRETEAFVRKAGLPSSIAIVMVNESGASVYSASEVAREEFPDYDLTVRGAVSIGRRLMDPLAELVKIDPKSIGVGQYQHDVDQHALKEKLDETVMSCVNSVGVELNTASKQILTYVSGLGPQLAKNIVEYRDQNGPFNSRKELLKVARMGEKAFEQCAGFLRIRDAKHPLDASAVHPESYHLVEKMAKDLGCEIEDLLKKPELRKKIDPKKYVTDTIGLPTLNDILQELEKPGRDPREKFEMFSFAEGIEKPSDLKVGMRLPGIVTNITKFGVFVDIGVHQDGLVHISHLADKFVSDPNEVVKVAQKVNVTVLEVDLQRKRISLSMKADPMTGQAKEKKPKRKASANDSGGDMNDMLAKLKQKFK